MIIDPDPVIKALAREIIMESVKPYTPEQLAEIPLILNSKHRYFWCIDNQEFDILQDSFMEYGFQTFWNGVAGYTIRELQVEQSSRVCSEVMVPMHFGHNMIVRFTGERSAQLLTKCHDYHTYKNDESTYQSFGIYVDDLEKCDDGIWRIKILRLTSIVLNGVLGTKE